VNGRKPKVTLDQYRRLLEIRKLRRQIPSDKELSHELGLPVSTVSKAISNGLKRYDIELAKEVQP
jgi:DNA-directed RNA polymerase specialized sigma24 family protein